MSGGRIQGDGEKAGAKFVASVIYLIDGSAECSV